VVIPNAPNNSTDLKQQIFDPVQVIRPALEFNVLRAFAKNGVYFINQETGDYVDGLLKLPSIGITLTPPQKEESNTANFGFLNFNRKSTSRSDPNTYEIDGVLFFSYSDPNKEFSTGYIDIEDAYLYYVKIWNDVELRVWVDILEKIVAEFTEEVDGKPHHKVLFYLDSVYVPKDITKPNKLVLPIQNKYGSNPTNACSTKEIPFDDDWNEE